MVPLQLSPVASWRDRGADDVRCIREVVVGMRGERGRESPVEGLGWWQSEMTCEQRFPKRRGRMKEGRR